MQTIQTVMESLGITSHAMKSQATYHPLDPLSAQELQECVNIVRRTNGISAAVSGQARLHFKGIGLLEPFKSVLAPYLDEWHAAVESGNTPSRLPRQAHVLFGRKEQGDTQWFGKPSGVLDLPDVDILVDVPPSLVPFQITSLP
jgi:Cu2+-containing amine oxidase